MNDAIKTLTNDLARLNMNTMNHLIRTETDSALRQVRRAAAILKAAQNTVDWATREQIRLLANCPTTVA